MHPNTNINDINDGQDGGINKNSRRLVSAQKVGRGSSVQRQASLLLALYPTIA